MRKILSVLLALVMVCSFGISAMAAGSPVAENTAAEIAAEVIESIEVTDAEGNAANVEIVAMDDEDISEEDAAAIEEAIEAVPEDKAVVAAFVINSEDEVSEQSPLKFTFKCDGTNVVLYVNGKPMKIKLIGENLYEAEITETGAAVIACDEA